MKQILLLIIEFIRRLLGMTIDEANNKILRPAYDYLHIDIKVGGSTIISLDRDDIISCVLSLRGVETKLEAPELQASTIEIEAYYPGDDTDITDFRGKETVIEWQTGYFANRSKKRTFYATFDEEGVQLKNHVLTIKGTDFVGTISGSCDGQTVAFPLSTDWVPLKDILTDYLECSLWPLMPEQKAIEAAFAPNPNLQNVEIYYTGDNTVAWNDSYVYIKPESFRKLIAEWCNIFRGFDENRGSLPSSQEMVRRFVFRDAGRPTAGFCLLNNLTPGLGTPDSTAQDGTASWEIDYKLVADFEVEYGNPVKTVIMDNPGYGWLRSDNPVFETYTISPNSSFFLDWTEPHYLQSTAGSDASLVMTQLSNFTLKITNPTNTARNAKVCACPLTGHYTDIESKPNVVINTGLTEGDVIKMDDFLGLNGIAEDSQGGYFTMHVIKDNLESGLEHCGTKAPKWINFTWRGHPDMQPRDFIKFTEQDGTINWYEIDNLTLEQKDGGMVSKVRALYRCPFLFQ